MKRQRGYFQTAVKKGLSVPVTCRERVIHEKVWWKRVLDRRNSMCKSLG